MGRRVLPAEADPVVFGCTQITSFYYVVSRYISKAVHLRRVRALALTFTALRRLGLQPLKCGTGSGLPEMQSFMA